MAEQLVGTVSHYWGGIGVAGIDLTGSLRVGDTIHIVGATSDFTESVASIQIEHEAVEEAKAGDSVGVKVSDRARVGDDVYVTQ